MSLVRGFDRQHCRRRPRGGRERRERGRRGDERRGGEEPGAEDGRRPRAPSACERQERGRDCRDGGLREKDRVGGELRPQRGRDGGGGAATAGPGVSGRGMGGGATPAHSGCARGAGRSLRATPIAGGGADLSKGSRAREMPAATAAITTAVPAYAARRSRPGAAC